MRLMLRLLTAMTLSFSTVAHAELISGFENAMQGWDYIGDVTVQTSSVGLNPTQGHNFAFLTTLSTTGELTGPEYPYSGTNSPPSSVTRAFLGITTTMNQMTGFPGDGDYGMTGEGAAIKTLFTVSHPGFVSFDWNRIGMDGDNDYFTIWNDILGSRINGWIFNYGVPGAGADAYPFVPVNVGLCAHIGPYDNCSSDTFYNSQTGWHTMNVWIDTPGTYSIGFGMNEVAESTAPTVLALDNVRFNIVPEPSSIALLGLAMAGMGFARRRKHIH